MAEAVRPGVINARHAPTTQPHVAWGRCHIRCCKNPFKCTNDYRCECHASSADRGH